MKLKSNAIKNRDNFLIHIMAKFPFEETADAGVYYDKELKAEMAVSGNEVSFKFLYLACSPGSLTEINLLVK